MKAVKLYGYGGVDQLRYEDTPTPQPGPGEVLVRVKATSINPVDWKIREGYMKEQMPLQFPAILGRDVAGVVEAVGAGVDSFKPGDKVMGFVNESYAEYLVAKASVLSPVPAGLDLEEAGAIPLVVTTGAQLMERGVEPRPGQTVLVTGAAGNVGRTAVFVAKQHDVRVLAGVRREQKEEAEQLGADGVVALDDEGELASLPQVDAVADTVNGDLMQKLMGKIRKSGVLGTVLGKPDGADKFDIRVNAIFAQPDPNRLYRLAEDIAAGRFKIPVGKKFPLSQAAEAQKAAEEGGLGKVLLIP